VKGRTYGHKTYHHPEVGTFTLGYQTMQLEGTPGQRLNAYYAEPGTPGARARLTAPCGAAALTAFGSTRRRPAGCGGWRHASWHRRRSWPWRAYHPWRPAERGAGPTERLRRTRGCWHDDWNRARQFGQVLSDAKNEPMTNWPGLMELTPLPTSSTMPQYSCPIGAGLVTGLSPR
jgi:hypothetical protein